MVTLKPTTVLGSLVLLRLLTPTTLFAQETASQSNEAPAPFEDAAIPAVSDDASKQSQEDSSPAKAEPAKAHKAKAIKPLPIAKKAAISAAEHKTGKEKPASSAARAEEKHQDRSNLPASQPQVASQEKPVKLHDGSPITLSGVGLTIAPPKGWEISDQQAGFILVMQKHETEKEEKTVSGDTVKMSYDPNVKIAINFYELPVNGKISGPLRSFLEDYYSKKGNISNFTIDPEIKTIERTDGKKSFLIYSSFVMSGIKFGGAHMMVEGGDKSFLVSYSDVADHFMGTTKDKNFEQALGAMSSIVFESEPQSADFQKVAFIGGVIASLSCLFLTLLLIRRRNAKSFLTLDDEDAMIADDDAALDDDLIADEKWDDDVIPAFSRKRG